MMSQSNEKKPYYKRLWFKMLIATLIWFALIAGKGGPEDAGALIMILPLAWIILYLIDSQPARDQNAQTRQARYEQKLKEIDMNRSITPVDGKTYCKVNHGLPVSPKEKLELEIGEDALLIKTKANTYKISFKKLRIVTALKETELVKKGKNMIGRAVVGNMVAGQTGAMVGTATGIGEKKVKGNFLYIEYLNNAGETATLILSPLNYLPARTVAVHINKAAGLDTIEL